MDSYSGENFNIKTRKPYTITKQRERWTEDEHNSFLEALKLYGRAWQRIEEHIGTKTAVQIRSHAQKFFTKLEKEAVAKGVPVKQALDMEIPPPRPKRKPNYPYPRKTGLKIHPHMAEKHGKQDTLASSLQSLDLERKTLTEKTSHEDKLENTKTNEEGANGNLGPQEAPCASLSSENENSVPKVNPGVFRKFIPSTEEDLANHDESYITIETTKHQELDQDGNKHTNITSNISLFESSHRAHDNIIQGVQNYPRHVPVQVVDGNQVIHAKTSVAPEMSFHDHEHPNPNLFVDIAVASATSGHHINNASRFSTVPLFTPFSDNQENYRSFLHVSSTISSLMVSSLLQNPAAHAAASLAAKFWHPANATTSSGDQFNPETPPPSMEAIVAATVAAATAWWSAHGLLPFCTPFYPGSYACTFGTPVNVNQPRVYNNETDNTASECILHEEKMDVEKTEDFPHPVPAANLSSSEDSEEKSYTEGTPVNKKEMITVVDLHDISKTNRKQVDRSSCGSNTTSSSETEMDALEKHVKETEETGGSDVNESFSRRGRISIMSPNDSWKEVSEEGRLAFQALFSREVLPQSFSDTCTAAEKNQQNIVKNSELDLNRVSQEPGESNGLTLLRTGLGSVKLNVHHTGFKPYKRCSIEARESSNKIVSAKGVAYAGCQNDEKCPKRIRLETEVST